MNKYWIEESLKKGKEVKKIISIILLSSLLVFNSPFVYADNIIPAVGGTGSSDLMITQEAATFSVTVPTSLPITIDSSSVVTEASNVVIVNNSSGPVIVTNIAVNPMAGWTLDNYGADYTKTKVGVKRFGLRINNDAINDGMLTPAPGNWGSITGGSSLPLDYDATVAVQNNAIESTNIATVVFTVTWDEIGPGEADPPVKYILATDADFSGTTDGTFKYIGTAEYVEVPSVIKGVSVTDMKGMFESNSTLRGAKIPEGVRIMYKTFKYCTALDETPKLPSTPVMLGETFKGCTSLTTAPVIGYGTNQLFETFEGCTSLVQAPAIPESIFEMINTFKGCSSLTGSLVINSPISDYSEALNGAATNPGTNLVLSGTSVNLNQILATKSAESHIIREAGIEYTLAQDSDFNWQDDGYGTMVWKYIGTAKYVKIPTTINGEPIISIASMFEDNVDIKGVTHTNFDGHQIVII